MASTSEPAPDEPRAGVYPVAGLVRRARRIADMSQREMARSVGVARSTIAKVEAGVMMPSVELLGRILGAAGLHLAVVDQHGRVVRPMTDFEDVRDGAGRRYPAHLDTILDPEPGEWWADTYGLARPPETFRRSRAHRDMQRRRSQWEVRAKRHRGVPPPPIVEDGSWR
jgi:transcriptional regulator with XRE-family HTH domain